MSVPRYLCSYFLIAIVCCSASADDAPLLWKFQAGDEHHYQMTQSMDMGMVVGDREIETSFEQLLDMTWRIEQVDEQGEATMLQSVDRVRMEMQSPGQQEMSYDTDSDEAPTGFATMMAPMFEAMTAEPFKMSFTPRGEIKALVIPESLAKAMKAIPGAAAMGEMFSDEGFKNMIQQSSLILPEPKDLKPGFEWTTETVMKNAQFGQLEIETTYRYLGPREVEGKPYEVFSIAMEMNFGEGPGGMQMEIVNQESHGEILFDREAGRLESSKIQQVLEMNISVGTQEMKQNMVQTMLFNRVEPKKVGEKP